ncbi:MAG TPA: recombination mediator RecR [Thermodesulfobacteriota bacterium]|nr:recombination mediator RecR [Thermodesulfobacteriota bacterium]
MNYYAHPLRRLITELSRLPGIGEKTAARIAFHILSCSKEQALDLAQAIARVKEEITLCTSCFTFTDDDPCRICRDASRNNEVICVVETPGDLIALERSGVFKGKYHVLHGVLSPLSGIGPENLRIKELIARVEKGGVREIILATNPTVEGGTTALYLSKLLKPFSIKVTRIAQGVPMGGDIEYLDEVTLGKAIEGRTEITE